MSRFLSASIILALASIAHAGAQERRDTRPAASQATGRIAGTVVNAETGRPVRLADVSLTSSAGEFTTQTDDAGSFVFEKLPAAMYTLQASRPGFLDTIYGQGRPGTDTPGRRIPLKDREEITRLVFPLSQGGSISGIVRDDHGDPLFGATVRLSRWVMRDGRRTIEEVTAVETDERGAFRAGLLPSRQYVVAVSPPEMKAGDDAKAPVGFAPVFYPAATSLANAGTIALGVGEHRVNIDVVLPLVRLSTISGIVLDASGNPMPEFPVSLAEQGSALWWSEQGTMTEADGRFTLPRVTPGTYTVTAGERHVSFRKVDLEFHGAPGADIAIKGELLRVVRGVAEHWAATYRVDTTSEELTVAKRARGSASDDVSVAGGTNTDVTLRLSRPRDVTGRVLFEGASDKPASPFEVALRPATDFGEAYAAATADGAFSVKDVPPGRYFVEVSGLEKPWTLASALSAGVETLDAQLEVPRDRDVLDLTLTFRDRPIELSGAVTDALAQPVTDRRVIVFPLDERLWETSKDRIQSAMLTENGRYSFSELRPGTYWIGVIGDVEPDEWLFPDFLRQLMRAAVSVTLIEGQKKTQDLRVK